jgi:hypothetical protein
MNADGREIGKKRAGQRASEIGSPPPSLLWVVYSLFLFFIGVIPESV